LIINRLYPYYSLRAYCRRPQRYMAHGSTSAINARATPAILPTARVTPAILPTARDPRHPPHRPPWRLRHPPHCPPLPPAILPTARPAPPRHPRIHRAPALAPPASTSTVAPLRSQISHPHPPPHAVNGARPSSPRRRWRAQIQVAEDPPHPPPPPSRPPLCPRMRVCPASRDSGLHRRDPVPHPSARSPLVLRRGSPPRRADQRDPLPCRGVLLGLSPVTDLSMEYRGCLSPAIQKLGAISLWIEPMSPEGSTSATR
jgi:hypothetical protein